MPISKGETGAGSFTNGSIPFIFGGVFSQDNSNFFWDNINKRLGIGISSPASKLDVNGNTNINGNLTVSGTITGNVNVSNLVPYTGANQNVNLHSHNLSANSLTISSDSVIHGLTVGIGGGSMLGNTVLGANVLANNTTGDRNVAIGNRALFATQQSDNTAVGASALGGNSNSGEQNTAVGSQTLQGNTTGSSNAGFGYAALQFNTTGQDNVGIGKRALNFNTTGIYNIALGTSALYSNTTGGYNIAIGVETLANSEDDNNSIVIGSNAVGAGSNKAVIGNSNMTDIYLGSSNANANLHAKKIFLGSSSVPGCIIMGDTAGGVGYITLTSGVLTVSSTPPSACQ